MRLRTKLHRDLLNDAFPNKSLRLVDLIKRQNARVNRVARWRVRQLENLVVALNRTAFELDRAWEEERITTLAWSARNLLELSVWVDYCCASEENATRFKKDTSRDLYGMVASGKRADITPELGQEIDQLLRRFEKIFNTPTFNVADEYKRVAAAATEVGREKEFASCNKLFSKLAHPTAYAVNSKEPREFKKKFRGAIFMLGVQLAGKAIVRLTDFMFTHFPDPKLKKQGSTPRP